MAGGGSGEEGAEKLTGFSKHFNSVTLKGRANYTKLVFSVLGLTFLYFKFRPSKQ